MGFGGRNNLIPWGYLVSACVPLVFKTALYAVVFRRRRIEATLTSTIVIAGAPLLFGLLPFSLPWLASIIVAIGVSTFLCSRFTSASIYPDAILICTSAETLSYMLMHFLVLPIVY